MEKEGEEDKKKKRAAYRNRWKEVWETTPATD